MNQVNYADPPLVLPVKAENIPSLLKEIKQWVGWIVGKQKPNGKYDKLPVDQRGKVCNAHASVNHMNFDEALWLYENGFAAGIGFVLDGKPITIDGEDFYLTGIDLDFCVEFDVNSGSHHISPEAEKVWHSCSNTYMEVSPSGTGVRLFALSKILSASGNQNHKEMYCNGRYLTVTGHILGTGQILEATSAIRELHAEWFPAKQHAVQPSQRLMINAANEDNDSERVLSALSYLDADCGYDTWRDLVWAIKASGLECAEQIAREWSETAPYRFDEHGFNVVWNSFDPDRGIGLGTLFHHAKSRGWEPVPAMTVDDQGDILNGRLFADRYRSKYVFIHETGDLLKFTEAGWIHSEPGEADACAKAIVKHLQEEAAESFKRDPLSIETKQKLAHAARSSMQPRISAMIALAKSEPGMTVRLGDFDAAPHLLGVANGVLELRTSTLLVPAADILVSMRTRVAYDSNARCPLWMQFLGTVQPDKSVQRLLQQLTGIFLTGDSSLQKLIILFGLGANGKSTLIELISWLLGDYSLRIQTEMLMHHQRSPQGPSPDIVALKGRRLAYCNELEEGRRLDEARVKELTGGDTLTGRLPYAKHNATFVPTHNLVMVGNHKPEIHDMSHGMWRRVLLIPFDVQIPTAQQDAQLGEKLKNEASGILNWALAGYRDFLRYGLRIPKSITAATDNYRDEEDLLGEWIEEDCNVVIGGKVRIDDCYRSYKFWAESRGHRPLAQSRLTKRLKERGYDRDAGKRHYLGIELKTSMRGD